MRERRRVGEWESGREGDVGDGGRKKKHKEELHIRTYRYMTYTYSMTCIHVTHAYMTYINLQVRYIPGT